MKPYDTIMASSSSSDPSQEWVNMFFGQVVEKKTSLAARHEFNLCTQQENQSVNEFAAEIMKKAAPCDFKPFLDDALRDKFICGLRSEHIVRKLLSENELTFAKAFKLACAYEIEEEETINMIPAITYNKDMDFKTSGTNYKPEGGYCKPVEERCLCCGGVCLTKTCCKKTWNCFVCNKQGLLANKCHFRRGNFWHN